MAFLIASLFVHRSDLNGVIEVVKRIGVGPGNVRGLDLLKVVFDIFDLVMNVLLLAIRPQPVLDSLPRRDRKIYSVRCPLIN